MNYIIDIKVDNVPGAAVKPRMDIDNILIKNGWKKLDVYNLSGYRILKNLIMICNLLKLKVFGKKDDIYVVQWETELLKPLSKRQIEDYIPGKKILFLHDIRSLREGKRGFDEYDRFNKYDVIIAHNHRMKEWLENQGIKKPIIQLGIFDYLNDKKFVDEKNIEFKYPFQIVFAGNLSKGKSGFIYKEGLNSSCIFKLYGNNYEGVNLNHRYMGSFLPDEIVNIIEGHFGLVWDGTSIEECDGNYGKYLRFNSPHKLSLYLGAGIPVIVWTKSAMADFVLKNGIGFCVDKLSEIDNILTYITFDEYMKMRNRVKSIQNKLVNGLYTITALKNAEEYLG